MKGVQRHSPPPKPDSYGRGTLALIHGVQCIRFIIDAYEEIILHPEDFEKYFDTPFWKDEDEKNMAETLSNITTYSQVMKFPDIKIKDKITSEIIEGLLGKTVYTPVVVDMDAKPKHVGSEDCLYVYLSEDVYDYSNFACYPWKYERKQSTISEIVKKSDRDYLLLYLKKYTYIKIKLTDDLRNKILSQ